MDIVEFEQRMKNENLDTELNLELLQKLNHELMIRNPEHQCVVIIEEFMELIEQILQCGTEPNIFRERPRQTQLMLLEEIVDAFIVCNQLFELFGIESKQYDNDRIEEVEQELLDMRPFFLTTIMLPMTKIIHILTKKLRGKDVEVTITLVWNIHILYVGIKNARKIYGFTEADFNKAVNIKVERGFNKINQKSNEE